eukprot:8366828-Alexandrium_andersonii.AAC.1
MAPSQAVFGAVRGANAVDRAVQQPGLVVLGRVDMLHGSPHADFHLPLQQELRLLNLPQTGR